MGYAVTQNGSHLLKTLIVQQVYSMLKCGFEIKKNKTIFILI